MGGPLASAFLSCFTADLVVAAQSAVCGADDCARTQTGTANSLPPQKLSGSVGGGTPKDEFATCPQLISTLARSDSEP
jgi:hypothetical protein